MDWDKLRVFHAVAEAGSFTHAGDALNLSQSAVSRQISALEESLKVPLFHRHARGLILTEQGEVLHRAAREIFAKLSMTEAMLSDSKVRPKGPLKITTTFAFGSVWLVPHLREFMEQYADIQVTVLIDDRELDLAMREADVAIRMSPPRQPDLIQRHLTTLKIHLCAHKSYIAARGLPETAEGLTDHTLIGFPGNMHLPYPNANWIFDLAKVDPQRQQGLMLINNTYAIFKAMQAGIGIAAVPSFLSDGQKDLVRVLPDMSSPDIGAYFVYAEELKHSKRIAVLRDFLVKRLAEGIAA